MDLNEQLLKLTNQENNYNSSSLIYAYCSALPKINTYVIDIVNVFIHLKNENLECGDFEQAYFLFCQQSLDRSKVGLSFILEQSKSSYPLLGNTIMAAAKLDSSWVIEQLSTLLKHQSAGIRLQVYSTIGRVSLTDLDLPSVRLKLLESALNIETDSSEKSEIFRSAFFIAKQTATLWPQVQLLFEQCLQKYEPLVIQEASYLAAFNGQELPDSVVTYLMPYFKDTTPAQSKTLNYLSYFIRNEINGEKCSLVEDLLETLLIKNNGLKVSDFQHLDHELMKELNSDFLNRIVTKWFLMGDIQLCCALYDVITKGDRDRTELSIDESALPLTDNEFLFLVRKTVGWLFYTPVAAISFLLSIIPHTNADLKTQITQLLYDPLLLSYTGKGKDFLMKKIENTDISTQALINQILSDLERYQADFKDIKLVKELRVSQKEVNIYWQDFEEKMSQSMSEARKGSIVDLIATTQTILYGNDVVTSSTLGNENQRIKNTMHSMRYSYEVPKMSVIDPEGLDMMLRAFRHERLENEIDS
ncbi:hypothetical protein [Pseudoalteromonas rhizosphaerae]|uniref:Uncharacterized protein n=1 Tax=Pseudoalteromonas rhizosphaerae TaxID=2518973 RepID=A0ABW8L2D3_9GAMM